MLTEEGLDAAKGLQHTPATDTVYYYTKACLIILRLSSIYAVALVLLSHGSNAGTANIAWRLQV